jgi:hypothetical protein
MQAATLDRRRRNLASGRAWSLPVSSAKNGKKTKKGKHGLPRVHENGLPADVLAEELARQARQLQALDTALRELAASDAARAQQLQRVLAAQQRTNSLLELSLASAFDLEIEG